MGPVGVGKTFLATALGHAAIRRRHSVHFERAGQLLKRLKAARLDNSHDTEIRKLLRVDPLILDDYCLQPMDTADTADIYEIIVERHRAAATITTSNREPAEWLALMADPLLAQSAIDRLQSAAYELVLDGESCSRRVLGGGACGQGPGVPVAHRVEDTGEQVTGRCGLGDVLRLAAAAGDDAVFDVTDRAAGGLVLDRLHHRPPQER